MMQSTARQTLRFRDFELDVEAYQLRRQGRPIKLERQPMELLILLIERRGRMVSRGDIAERLWGKDVFVDVETGVNIAIRKIGHAQQAQALAQLGQHEAALEALMRTGRFSGGTHMTLAAKGHLLATLGRTAEARDVLRTLQEGTRERYVPPTTVALVYAGLGDSAQVFGWLEKAYRAHDVHLAFLPVDPRWAAYRADPRFDDLVARCGFRRETTQ
jgi:hypothetical protein